MNFYDQHRSCVYGLPTSGLSPAFADWDSVELAEKKKYEEAKQKKSRGGACSFPI